MRFLCASFVFQINLYYCYFLALIITNVRSTLDKIWRKFGLKFLIFRNHRNVASKPHSKFFPWHKSCKISGMISMLFLWRTKKWASFAAFTSPKSSLTRKQTTNRRSHEMRIFVATNGFMNIFVFIFWRRKNSLAIA